MTIGLYQLLWLIFYIILVIASCNGKRCFQCTGVRYPSDCKNVTPCSDNEICCIQQKVTIDGNVAFDSGCLPKSNCQHVPPPLIGKRSEDMASKRSSSIITCTECCEEEFCNMKGCEIAEIPISQRGPYCFVCDGTNPKACQHVSVCNKDQVCMLYRPATTQSKTVITYKGACVTKAVCEAMKSLGDYQCDPICCNADFCNDRCGTSSYTTTVIPQHHFTAAPVTKHTEASTSRRQQNTHIKSTMTATTPPSKENASNGNCTVIHNEKDHMCVNIVSRYLRSWIEARQYCQTKYGGDLVVLNTLNKAHLLRTYLNQHIRNNLAIYWIGAKDYHNDDHFAWITSEVITDSESDWGTHQPVNLKQDKDRDCVAMYGHDDYKWHSLSCSGRRHFICEQ